MRKDETPQEGWDRFWKDILELPDGSIDVEQLKKELSDLSVLIHNMPIIIEYATGGAASNPMIDVDVVKALIDDHINELVDDAVQEHIKWEED